MPDRGFISLAYLIEPFTAILDSTTTFSPHLSRGNSDSPAIQPTKSALPLHFLLVGLLFFSRPVHFVLTILNVNISTE